MNKTQWRAKDLYFWKGMSSEINMLVQDCELCRPFLPSQGKEPIIPGISATGPMTDVGTDLFQIGHNHYIVMMDRYSGFPFVEKLTKLSTSAIIKVLATWFNTFGWPERLRSDNGPQYRSEFDEFCKDNNIIHENSSPYCPQSNGLSEAAVKQMKYLLQKCNQNLNDFHCSLLEFRNTTNVSGKSPAQMFFGRRLRGKDHRRRQALLHAQQQQRILPRPSRAAHPASGYKQYSIPPDSALQGMSTASCALRGC